MPLLYHAAFPHSARVATWNVLSLNPVVFFAAALFAGLLAFVLIKLVRM